MFSKAPEQPPQSDSPPQSDGPEGSAAEGSGGSATEGSEHREEAEQHIEAGPCVLWRARAITKEFKAVETSFGYYAAITAGGIGLGLLGIAPFTPPRSFMIGLLLAVVQVRLAHTWLTRQLRAQARRHVTELVQTQEFVSKEGVRTAVLSVACDGGLSRTLRLSSVPAASTKPPLADVLRQGGTFVFLDQALGSSDAPEALERVLQSECTIVGEDVTVKPFPDESQDEADKLVQPLLSLTRDHLKNLEGKDSASPTEMLARIERTSMLTAAFIAVGGVVVCASGRYTAAKSEGQPA